MDGAYSQTGIFTISCGSNPAGKSSDLVLLQVAYGLVSRWRSQVGSQQTIRRLGLQDLLKRVGLRAHQSKSGDEPTDSAVCSCSWTMEQKPMQLHLQQYAESYPGACLCPAVLKLVSYSARDCMQVFCNDPGEFSRLCMLRYNPDPKLSFGHRVCHVVCIEADHIALCADVRAMMAQDPNLWQHRPLSSELQQYAAADVSQLLAVADRLFAMLGIVGQETVKVLSQASCQLKLPVMPGTQVGYSLCVFTNYVLCLN